VEAQKCTLLVICNTSFFHSIACTFVGSGTQTRESGVLQGPERKGEGPEKANE